MSNNLGFNTDSLIYAFMITPRNIYRALIIIVILSGLITVYRLIYSSQWIVMQSFGVTTWQILRNIFLVQSLFVVIITYIGETYAIDAELYAKRIRTHSASGGAINYSINNLWFKEKNHYVHVKSVTTSQELEGIDFFEVVDHVFLKYRYAQKAVFKKNGLWVLSDVKEFDLTNSKLSKFNQVNWMSGLHPTVLVAAVAAPTRISLTKLFKALIHSKGFGILQDDTFNVFLTRVMTPIMAICSLSIILPIMFFNPLSHYANRNLSFALLLAIVVITIQQPITGAYQWLSIYLRVILITVGFMLLLYTKLMEVDH